MCSYYELITYFALATSIADLIQFILRPVTSRDQTNTPWTASGARSRHKASTTSTMTCSNSPACTTMSTRHWHCQQTFRQSINHSQSMSQCSLDRHSMQNNNFGFITQNLTDISDQMHCQQKFGKNPPQYRHHTNNITDRHRDELKHGRYKEIMCPAPPADHRQSWPTFVGVVQLPEKISR